MDEGRLFGPLSSSTSSRCGDTNSVGTLSTGREEKEGGGGGDGRGGGEGRGEEGKKK